MPLTKGSVLIVEDNLIVALDLEELFQAHGAERVEISGSVADAIEKINTIHFDVCLLEFMIGAENTIPVAELLRSKGIPFLFTTAYSSETLGRANFADIEMVAKPFVERELVERIALAMRPAS